MSNSRRPRPASSLLATLALGLVCLAARPAQADLLGVVLLTKPDLVAGSPTFSYNAATDLLTVTDDDLDITFDGTTLESVTGGSYVLEATISGTGVLSGGTLTISGAIPSRGIASTTLLTAKLTAFGFDTSPFFKADFTFTATGGALASNYAGVGGIILSSNKTGVNGFANSFTLTSPVTKVDTGLINPVPEPSSIAALAVGGVGLLGAALRRRLRRRKAD